MTANIALFDYEPLYRGPRFAGHYATLTSTHHQLSKNGDFVGRFMRELKRRNYYRPASAAAGLLTPENAVKLFKATMTLFARTQLQLDAMEQQTGKIAQAAKAVAKPPVKKAKGGFSSGAKSVASRINAMMAGLSNPSKSANADPDEDDGPSFPVGVSCNECSCRPPEPR